MQVPSSDFITVAFDSKTNSFHLIDKSSNGKISVELSEFDYPYFFDRHSKKKYTYNEALARILNSAVLSSQYLSDVSRLIKPVTNHRVYVQASNRNSRLKGENTIILMNMDTFESSFSLSDEDSVNEVKNYPVHPSSEKSVTEGVFVLSRNKLYEAVGYDFDGKTYSSIFPNKPNVPARFKAFITPDSVSLINPDVNYFLHGDENTKEALVVLVPSQKERFVSGEIAVEDFGQNTMFSIIKRIYYTETNIDEIGKVYYPDEIYLRTQYGNPLHLETLVSLELLDFNASFFKAKLTYSVNEARIVSHTGLKGYMSRMSDIGNLSLGKSLIKPDLVCGPSSFKGKVNQIKLAQALYAWRYIVGASEQLDSMDAELINELSDMCSAGKWISPEGDEYPCYYGLINVAFTDPSLLYSGNKYASFPFEMLKLALEEYPELASNILSQRDQDELELAREMTFLEESLRGIQTSLATTITLKSYLSSNDNSKRNPRLSSVEILPKEHWLLDIDREPVVLNVSSGVNIYVPSGKVLSSLCSESTNGFNYDIVLVWLSRLFSSLRFSTMTIESLKKVVSRHNRTISNSTVISPKLYSCNLKQVTLYNHTMTCSIPSKNYRQAINKIYPESKELGIEGYELYGMAIRNPSIWRNMFCIVKIIEGNDSNVVKVSHDVTMSSKADNDGDSMPIYFGNDETQSIMEGLYSNQFSSTYLESEWQKEYYLDEADSSIFEDMSNEKKSKYVIYQFSSSDFIKRLFDAAIAKGTVGVGTIQYWIYSDALSIYQSIQGSKVELGGKEITLKKLPRTLYNELKALYAIVLQEGVISAIKHVENGSDGYKNFLLERLGGTQKSQVLVKEIQEMMSFMSINGDNDVLKADVLNMLFYTTALFCSSRLDYFSELQRMYSHYNGGKELETPLSDMIKDTSFYRIISIIDKWKNEFCDSSNPISSSVISAPTGEYAGLSF